MTILAPDMPVHMDAAMEPGSFVEAEPDCLLTVYWCTRPARQCGRRVYCWGWLMSQPHLVLVNWHSRGADEIITISP